ncbi:MAG: CPBP family intramembrane metalloprotease [Lentisphaeraceae bacterium]|nr:CPBP family intramembrane metalloprotease [Lentisphaeraceae bacterium]
MRTLIIFGSYLAYIFILGSFLAYPLYELVQSIFPEGSYIAEKPFGKVANRGYMLVALLGFYPVWKGLKCNSKTDLGFDISKKGFYQEFRSGLIFGFFSLILLGILIVSLGIRPFENDATISMVIKAFFTVLPGAIILAFIEEIFFRGVLLNSMSRSLNAVKAILLTSFIFATIHFLRNKTDGVIVDPNWFSGFTYLKTTFVNYSDPKFIGSWLTLFSCSVFLSFLSLHHGNIARCVGVHAGWVLILGVVKKITDDDKNSPLDWMIGSYDKVTGYLAFIIISSICFFFWLIKYRTQKTKE